MDIVGEVLAFAGMVLISVSILVLIVDICGRKTIGFTIFGINDINQLLIMACICLAMPLTFLREGHVGVDFVTDLLPRRPLAVLKLVVALVSGGWVVVLAYFAYVQAVAQIAMDTGSPTLAIPIVWFWIPLLIGMTMSAVACLVHVLRHVIALFSGHDPLGSRYPGEVEPG